MRISDWSADVCSSDLLIPADPDEAPSPALRYPVTALLRVLHDGPPGRHRGHRLASLAPVTDEPRPHERVLDARAGIEIPAIARTAGATARRMVGKVRPGARIVGQIGRAHVWTPVTNVQHVCRL